MNGYDFDKTIYHKDSSVEFYLFLVKKYKKFSHLLTFSVYYVLYKLKFHTKIEAKEKMFSILSSIENIDLEVEEFWSKRSLEKWYLENQKNNDVVISASPYFLLKPFCSKNNIQTLIASSVDKKTGKFNGENCYGIVKCKKYKEIFPKQKMHNFYSDSKTDMVLLDVSDNFYLVKKNKITKKVKFKCLKSNK